MLYISRCLSHASSWISLWDWSYVAVVGKYIVIEASEIDIIWHVCDSILKYWHFLQWNENLFFKQRTHFLKDINSITR